MASPTSPKPDDDVHDPGGQHLGEELAELQHAGARLFGGFGHHRVSPSESGGCLDPEHPHGHIERDDGTYHAVGLTASESQGVGVQHRGLTAGGQQGVVPGPVPGRGHRHGVDGFGHLKEVAVVRGFQAGQLLPVFGEYLCRALEIGAACA